MKIICRRSFEPSCGTWGFLKTHSFSYDGRGSLWFFKIIFGLFLLFRLGFMCSFCLHLELWFCHIFASLLLDFHNWLIHGSLGLVFLTLLFFLFLARLFFDFFITRCIARASRWRRGFLSTSLTFLFLFVFSFLFLGRWRLWTRIILPSQIFLSFQLLGVNCDCLLFQLIVFLLESL